MKVKEIRIAGTTSDLSPDDRPSLSIHGVEGTGKSRLACTAPDPIGYLAIDKKAKRTVEKIAEELGKQVIVNQKPFLSDQEAIRLATEEDVDKVKKAYTEVVKAIVDMGCAFAAHKDIQTIVVDTNSQLFDYMLFSHFGRRTQIKPTSRGAVNQDMIDFVNALRTKNLILVHRSIEVWKATGAKDKDGQDIKEPSGKFETDGYKNIGAFVTATLELTNDKRATKLEEKFKCRVVTCQTDSLLEGQLLDKYGISGEGLTWDSLMLKLGME